MYGCGLVYTHRWICISYFSSFLDVCFFPPSFFLLEFALCFQQQTHTFFDASYQMSAIATRISISYRCGLVCTHRWIFVSIVFLFLAARFFPPFFLLLVLHFVSSSRHTHVCDTSYQLSAIATRISISYRCGLVNAHRQIFVSSVSSFLDAHISPSFFLDFALCFQH